MFLFFDVSGVSFSFCFAVYVFLGGGVIFLNVFFGFVNVLFGFKWF